MTSFFLVFERMFLKIPDFSIGIGIFTEINYELTKIPPPPIK